MLLHIDVNLPLQQIEKDKRAFFETTRQPDLIQALEAVLQSNRNLSNHLTLEKCTITITQSTAQAIVLEKQYQFHQRT